MIEQIVNKLIFDTKDKVKIDTSILFEQKDIFISEIQVIENVLKTINLRLQNNNFNFIKPGLFLSFIFCRTVSMSWCIT